VPEATASAARRVDREAIHCSRSATLNRKHRSPSRTTGTSPAAAHAIRDRREMPSALAASCGLSKSRPAGEEGGAGRGMGLRRVLIAHPLAVRPRLARVREEPVPQFQGQTTEPARLERAESARPQLQREATARERGIVGPLVQLAEAWIECSSCFHCPLTTEGVNDRIPPETRQITLVLALRNGQALS
jgi:hypothetical protein